MANEKFDYKIIGPYMEAINTQDDFVDMEVNVGDKKYFGSATTTRFIDRKLREYNETGENKNGSYFCAKGAIILRDLEDKTIKKTLQDLIETGDLGEFLDA